MQKISGGNLLECGHNQVISAFRYAAYQAGLNQRPVWCVECNGWTNILPAPITEPEVDNLPDNVLDFPHDDK